MGKKLSLLEKGIVVRPMPDGIIKRAMAEGKRKDEMHEKTLALFGKYKVNLGDFQTLALRLAIKHEPGFKLIAPPGPQKGRVWLWDSKRNEELLAEFDRFKHLNLSVRKVAKMVHARRAFAGQTAEALRKQYAKLMQESMGS